MNLYLIKQSQNDSYDTYDECIVAAQDEASAKRTHPHGYVWNDDLQSWCSSEGKSIGQDCWACNIEAVSVTLLGTAKVGTEPGMILGSFISG